MLRPELLSKLLSFRSDRDWEQFHSPRNLATAICTEAAELLEPFRWTSEKQVEQNLTSMRAEISQEIADLVILISYLAHDLSIDIDEAVDKKLEINALKYPAEQFRGSNRKYVKNS